MTWPEHAAKSAGLSAVGRASDAADRRIRFGGSSADLGHRVAEAVEHRAQERQRIAQGIEFDVNLTAGRITADRTEPGHHAEAVVDPVQR